MQRASFYSGQLPFLLQFTSAFDIDFDLSITGYASYFLVGPIFEVFVCSRGLGVIQSAPEGLLGVHASLSYKAKSVLVQDNHELLFLCAHC